MKEYVAVTDDCGRAWAETEPGLWRSTDGQYTIHRTALPEPRKALAVIYTLRWREPSTARAWPGWLGCELGTAGPRYDLAAAQQEASDHARAHAAAPGNDRALRELPVLASERFFWPMSEGTTRGALTVTLESGRLTARVTDMVCQSEDPAPAGTWAPGTWAEIDITGLWQKVAVARFRAAVRRLALRVRSPRGVSW
jgi:hypothetical protein